MFTNLNEIQFNLNWANQQLTPNSATVVRDGDVKGRTLVFNITDGTLPIDLTNCTAFLYWKHTVEHKSGMAECTIDPINSIIYAPIPVAMQMVVGDVDANLRITDATGVQILSTRTMRLYVERSGIDLTTPLTTDQYSALDSMVAEIQGLESLDASFASMASNVASNTGSIASLSSGATSMSSAIANNTSLIASQVSSNMADTASLATNISLNSSGIASNASTIGSVATSASSGISSASSTTSSLVSSLTSSVSAMTGDDFDVSSSNTATIANAITQIQAQQEQNTNSLASLGTASSLNAGYSAGELPPIQATGLLPSSILPPPPLMTTFVGLDANKTTQTTAIQGDIYVATDTSVTYVLQQTPPTVASNWVQLATPTGGVTSVQGQSGAVTFTSNDGSITINTLDFAVNWNDMPLPTATLLTNGEDLNTVDGENISAYVAQGLTTIVNAPENNSPQNFTMIYRGNYDATTNPAGNGTQTLYYSSTGNAYSRTVFAGVWTAWQYVPKESDLTAIESATSSYTDSVASSVGSSVASSASSYTSSVAVSLVADDSLVSSNASSQAVSAQSTAVSLAFSNDSNVSSFASSATASVVANNQSNFVVIGSDLASLSSEIISNASVASSATSSVASSASSGISANSSATVANSTAISNIVNGTTAVSMADQSVNLVINNAVSTDFNTYTTVGSYWFAYTGTNFTNAYNNGVAQLLTVQKLSNGDLIQITYPASGASYAFNSQIATRYYTLSTTTWSPWEASITSWNIQQQNVNGASQIRTNVTATATTNIDTLSQTSIYVSSTVTPLGTVPTGFVGTNYMIVQYYQSATLQSQTAINLTTGVQATRNYNGTSWSAWMFMGSNKYQDTAWASVNINTLSAANGGSGLISWRIKNDTLIINSGTAGLSQTTSSTTASFNISSLIPSGATVDNVVFGAINNTAGTIMVGLFQNSANMNFVSPTAFTQFNCSAVIALH